MLSQVANGVWLPIVLIFMHAADQSEGLDGRLRNTPTFNVIAWVTSVAMIALTLVLIYFGLFIPNAAGAGCSVAEIEILTLPRSLDDRN